MRKDNVTIEDIHVSNVTFDASVARDDVTEFSLAHSGVGFLTSNENTYRRVGRSVFEQEQGRFVQDPTTRSDLRLPSNWGGCGC
jgi:hypothetical protein